MQTIQLQIRETKPFSDLTGWYNPNYFHSTNRQGILKLYLLVMQERCLRRKQNTYRS